MHPTDILPLNPDIPFVPQTINDNISICDNLVDNNVTIQHKEYGVHIFDISPPMQKIVVAILLVMIFEIKKIRNLVK